MAHNAQKTPFVSSLSSFARLKILNQLQLEGKALPASVVSLNGWIVTVNFEIQPNQAGTFTLPQVTIPVASSDYDYLPLQKGDKGLVVPSDTYLGGISGLGGGTASLGLRPNLSALIFVPVGNKEFAFNWPAPTTANSRVIQGPDGVSFWDIGQNCTIVLTPTLITITGKDSVTVQDKNGNIIVQNSDGTVITDANGNVITMAAAGITLADDNSNTITMSSSGVAIDGVLTINGDPYLAHEHGGGTIGSGNTSGVL